MLTTHDSAEKGLSKMKRNHIHLAQGMAGDSVISGAPCSRYSLDCTNIAHRHAEFVGNIHIY